MKPNVKEFAKGVLEANQWAQKKDENHGPTLAEILDEVSEECAQQGEQDYPDGTGHSFWAESSDGVKVTTDQARRLGVCTFRHILYEEVMEAFAESDEDLLRAELVQVAAVAAQWISAIDRRKYLRRQK